LIALLYNIMYVARNKLARSYILQEKVARGVLHPEVHPYEDATGTEEEEEEAI